MPLRFVSRRRFFFLSLPSFFFFEGKKRGKRGGEGVVVLMEKSGLHFGLYIFACQRELGESEKG